MGAALTQPGDQLPLHLPIGGGYHIGVSGFSAHLPHRLGPQSPDLFGGGPHHLQRDGEEVSRSGALGRVQAHTDGCLRSRCWACPACTLGWRPRTWLQFDAYASRTPPRQPRADHGLVCHDRTEYRSLLPGRSSVSETRQTGADVRSITDTLITRARQAGGRIGSAVVAQVVEGAAITPEQAKKVLRALADAGVTVVVDGSASLRRRRAVAARSSSAKSTTRTSQVDAQVGDGSTDSTSTESPSTRSRSRTTKSSGTTRSSSRSGTRAKSTTSEASPGPGGFRHRQRGGR